MSRAHQLGELQLAIMHVLWRRGEATVADVHRELAEARAPRALTTVATMLSKMERKGVVAHRTEGRQFVYRATASEADVRRSMVSSLTDSLFRGDTAALVTHLLEEGEIDAAELEDLRRRIQARDARRGTEEDRDGR